MSERAAFGPNLRRLRIQRGVSIEQIAAATKVPAALWKGLERNDFSRWPNGIYARSFVREYAGAIGVDPESTVDDFCSWFPQGDRRAELLIRGHAEIVGHDNLEWQDHVPPVAVGERRGSLIVDKPPPPGPSGAHSLMQMFVRVRRALLRSA